MRTAQPEVRLPVAITVIIVHYRTEDHLTRCLDDLASRSDRPMQVVVVDSASLRQPDDWRARYSGVEWLNLTDNRGFAVAVNAGARIATGDVLLFLNPDARLEPGSLDALAAVMMERRDAGVVAPQLVSPQGSSQPSGGSFPTFSALVVQKFARLAGRQRLLPTDPVGSDPVLLDWVSATAMLCRRTAFDAVGGMDESLFLYYEDCDFCSRLQAKGWRSYLVPAARAVHESGASFGGDWRSRLAAFRSSEDRYFRKHRPRWESWALRLVRPIYDRFGLRRTLYHLSPSQIPDR